MTKKNRGIRELEEMLNNDGLNISEADEERTGISSKGDLTLTFKNRKYSIDVERKESISNKKLEQDKDNNDILIFRKNRKNWKVYLDLSTLILLLLNNRS